MPGSLRDDAALFRDRQGAADVAKSAEKEVQTDEKAQLARLIFKSLRKRKSTLEFGANLIAVSAGVHRRPRQGFLKNHLLSRASSDVVERG